MQMSGQIKLDIETFWMSNRDRVPTLAALALKYKNAVTNSAGAARNNSLYSNVLSDKRRSFISTKIVGTGIPLL